MCTCNGDYVCGYHREHPTGRCVVVLRRIAMVLLLLIATTGCVYSGGFAADSSIDGQLGLTESYVKIAVPSFEARVALHAASWNPILKLLGLPELPIG